LGGVGTGREQPRERMKIASEALKGTEGRSCMWPVVDRATSERERRGSGVRFRVSFLGAVQRGLEGA
jgi:hypothetical protein